MLHSFQAQINGSQLIWIDQPPAPLMHQRVLVVVEDIGGQALMAKAAMNPVQGFLNARGCLGQASRQDVLAGLDQMRDDWNRDPASTQDGKKNH